ncbi:arsenite methyltransferase [Balneola sp. MJW-20]|uniref:arsenite methyltransferase n=1 Tax=Gracilimonas aurantiaca TaxID=3234185 RepID=UPI003465EE51
MNRSTPSPEELKETVRRKYELISEQGADYNARTCCGASGESSKVYNIMTDDYSDLRGYHAEADLGLGCGLPTQFAQIRKGDTVIDLGSGAGNDCFVARHETGPEGKVIGIDFTVSMINKARSNAEKLGYNNVEFRFGDLEAMPVNDDTADVVVSNCVLNLVPDKDRVFQEIYRVLKPGGHFSISDIVIEGELPEALKHDAEMYAGCVSGAIQKEDYLNLIRKQGFTDLSIQKEKPIFLPEDILVQYLNKEEIEDFHAGETGIFSITVYAQKAGKRTKKRNLMKKKNCEPGSGCC